jgi:hypothetical protein
MASGTSLSGNVLWTTGVSLPMLGFLLLAVLLHALALLVDRLESASDRCRWSGPPGGLLVLPSPSGSSPYPAQVALTRTTSDGRQ